VGDLDGAASTAQFNFPWDVYPSANFSSASDFLFIADTGNGKLRLLRGGGVSTVVSGAGLLALGTFYGDQQTLVFPAGSTIKQAGMNGAASVIAGTGAAGFSDGPAASASFNLPRGVFFSAPSIFVADTENNRIRLINGTAVSTFAGGGAASYAEGVGTAALFNKPYSLVGNGTALFIADYANNRIRVCGMASRAVSTFAGSGAQAAVDGAQLSASFNHPSALAVSVGSNGFPSSSAVFVSDEGGHCIRMIFDGRVTTIAGSATGASGAADGFGRASTFYYPFGIKATAGGILVVADTYNSKIRQLTCAPCPASFFCFSGSPVLCPAGSYCPLSSANATRCPPGSYSNAGASSCAPCPAGTFTSSTGSPSCQPCPGGHYCPAGTSTWARLNCGRGSYCPEGSSAPTPCPIQVSPLPYTSWPQHPLGVQGAAFLDENAGCLGQCFWTLDSGTGWLSKC
jgi:hypothetical protein